MRSLRIDGATLLAVDGSPEAPIGDPRPASIRIRGESIAAIGDLDPEPDEAVLDARGLIALPGFVQVHVHYCQTLLRGLADDLPLLRWLSDRIWPLEAAHDLESTEASAQLAVLELLAGGTTTVQGMESVRHTEATFEVAATTGMTTVLGNCLMDIEGPGAAQLAVSACEAMRISEALCDAFDGRGRLRYAVAPRFVLSCSEGLAREAAAFAANRDLRIHSHACEHPEEIAAVRAQCGADSIAVLHRQGLLGPRTGLAHCVHLTDAERRLLVETDTAVLHCPSANLKLGSGIAPICELAALGLRHGLGADGAPCNNRLSALTELRQAALLQALVAGPGAWPAAKALFAATRGGAEALGLAGELGSLEVGKRADLVLLDLSRHAPGGDPVSTLVFQAEDSDVRHVLVGGEVVVRDRRVLLLDGEQVRRRAAQQRDRLLQRAGLRA